MRSRQYCCRSIRSTVRSTLHASSSWSGCLTRCRQPRISPLLIWRIWLCGPLLIQLCWLPAMVSGATRCYITGRLTSYCLGQIPIFNLLKTTATVQLRTASLIQHSPTSSIRPRQPPIPRRRSSLKMILSNQFNRLGVGCSHATRICIQPATLNFRQASLTKRSALIILITLLMDMSYLTCILVVSPTASSTTKCQRIQSGKAESRI